MVTTVDTPEPDDSRPKLGERSARRRHEADAAGSMGVVFGGSNVFVNSGSMESVSIGSTYSPKADEGDDRSAEYVADLQAEVSGLERASKRRLLAYRTLRFLVLTTSAITPALALLSAPSWITAAVASLAFLSEGTIQLTRMHDRAVLDIRRVSLLGRELRMFRTQVGNYTNTDRRLLLLVQRIEAIREENDRDVLNVLQQSFGAYGQERPSANESGRPEGRPPPVT